MQNFKNPESEKQKKNEKPEKRSNPSSSTNAKQKALQECIISCLKTGKQCMDEGKKKTACLCAECAEICQLALKATCCQSEFQQQISDLCAEVCKRCSEECERDQSCQECSQKCKECAECCSTPSYSYR